MRRNYISPEFSYTKVNGTLNMAEESNFFGAKMLEVEDSILISNENIVYYQRTNGEQINIDIEKTLVSSIFSSSDTKNEYHTLVIDETQSQYMRENDTRYVMDIDIESILREYVFAQMKNHRTFEGMRSTMTISGDVNIAMREYITLNVINRYKISKIDLYIRYNSLKEQNVLRYNNIWNNKIISTEFAMTKFQTISDYEGKTSRIIFNQEKPSKSYRFDYFFDLKFDKI